MSAAAQEEPRTPYLLVRARPHVAAIPVAHVAETLRPLPTRALAGAPAFVLGLALIRGDPTAVVDLGAVLAGAGGAGGAPGRWLTVRCGARTVALAVDAVVSVRALAASCLAGLPPLLPSGSAVSQLATLDGELALVLDASRLVPEALWPTLDSRSDAGAGGSTP